MTINYFHSYISRGYDMLIYMCCCCCNVSVVYHSCTLTQIMIEKKFKTLIILASVIKTE